MNQEDTKERNHQVSQMAGIYFSALAVYAYLGRTPETQLALLDFWVLDYLENKTRPSRNQIPGPDSLLSCLDILTRSYWTRIWIIQELRLASEVVFWFHKGEHVHQRWMWGLCRCAEDENHLVCEAADEHSGPLVDNYRKQGVSFHRDHGAATIRFIRSLGTTLWISDGLQETLQNFGESLCSDPRDKIFGLQSIVQQSQRVPVDYSLSLDEVWILVLRIIIRELLVLYTHEQGRRNRVDYRQRFWDNRKAPRVISELAELPMRMLAPSPQLSEAARALCWSRFTAQYVLPLSDFGYQILSSRIWPTTLERINQCAISKKQKALVKDWRHLFKSYEKCRKALGGLHRHGRLVVTRHEAKGVYWNKATRTLADNTHWREYNTEPFIPYYDRKAFCE